MEHEDPSSTEAEPSPTQDAHRGLGRLVPPAVTPLRMTDIAAGMLGQIGGRGLDTFRETIRDCIDGARTATYPSYRRALGACLRALTEGDRSGDVVLIPAFCSADFVHAIEGVGLRPRRYDVDPETLAMDLEAVRRHTDGDVLALVAVNVLGYTSPMDAVARLCTERDVALIETLGYAVGSAYRGQELGTFGDCAVLNFQQGKPIPVGGGMVVSRNAAIDVSDAGRSAATPNVAVLAGYAAAGRPRMYGLYTAVANFAEQHDLLGPLTTHPGSKHDVAYEPPYDTMSDFQGAVGTRVLDRLQSHREHRARNAAFYADQLADCQHLSLVRAIEGLEGHQFVRYPIVLDTPSRREDVRRALRRAGIHAVPLYDWPPIDGNRFPGAARLQRGLLTLPTHPYVTQRDRQTVVKVVRSGVTDHGP